MIVTAIDLSHGLEGILNSLMTQGAALGWTLIKAFLVFIVGRLLINLVNKLIKRVLLKRDIDPSVKTFVGSLVNVVLTIIDHLGCRCFGCTNDFVCCSSCFCRCCCRYGFER